MSLRTTLSIIVVSLVFGLAVQQPKRGPTPASQQTANASLADEKHAAEIESFIASAQSAPAEFSADLLIQLAQSGEIKDAKRKQELLVEAFYASAKAKQAVKLVALPGSAVDSRSGYKASASSFGLEALSLQCRAINALLPLDKRKARELFSEIKLKLEPLSCEDALAYDVNSFFTTMQALAQSAFSADEMGRGEHVFFVENYLAKISSPNQVGAAAKMLASLTLTDLELTNLNRAFSSALKNMPSDYRSFSADRDAVAQSVRQLAARLSSQGLSGDELLEAYRTFLVNQLSSRCGGTRAVRASDSNLIVDFNDNLRPAAYKKIAPISDEELTPTKVGAAAKEEAFWSSPKAQSILSRIKKLRFSAKGSEFSEDEKQSADWQSQLSELVRELAAWTAADENSEEDYFHQKSVIYYALIPIIPADAQYNGVRDEALRDFATMLSTSPLQKDKPSEWFLHARVLIDRVNKSQPPDREKLLNLVYSSRSPVLHLYVQKQQLFKTTSN